MCSTCCRYVQHHSTVIFPTVSCTNAEARGHNSPNQTQQKSAEVMFQSIPSPDSNLFWLTLQSKTCQSKTFESTSLPTVM